MNVSPRLGSCARLPGNAVPTFQNRYFGPDEWPRFTARRYNMFFVLNGKERKKERKERKKGRGFGGSWARSTGQETGAGAPDARDKHRGPRRVPLNRSRSPSGGGPARAVAPPPCGRALNGPFVSGAAFTGGGGGLPVGVFFLTGDSLQCKRPGAFDERRDWTTPRRKCPRWQCSTRRILTVNNAREIFCVIPNLIFFFSWSPPLNTFNLAVATIGTP